MKIKRLLLGTAVFCWAVASGQQKDHEPAEAEFSFHGNVDVFYKHSFHGLKKGLTSFTGPDQRFELGMASVQLGYQAKKLGAYVDLGFGPRARDFAYTDQGAMAAVKQAYVYFEPMDHLRFTAGTFATHIGYELLDPAGNANYSMSYLFSTGPFSNTGLKVEYQYGAHHLMAGISNPTDYRQVPENVYNKKTIIARYSFEKQNGLLLAVNYSGGKQLDTVNMQQIDVVATVPLSRFMMVGWNGSVVWNRLPGQKGAEGLVESWWGQAVYVKATLAPRIDLSLRGEYFKDEKGRSALALNGDVWSGTATLSYSQGPFRIMPEIRWDYFSTPYDGSPDRGQVYGLLAVVFQF